MEEYFSRSLVPTGRFAEISIMVCLRRLRLATASLRLVPCFDGQDKFILDTRKQREAWMLEQREKLARLVLDASPLPLETKRQILRYLEPLNPRTGYGHYLQLDEVYLPFPMVDKQPAGPSAHGTKAEKRSTHDFVVWNLALRCFPTFEQTSGRKLARCYPLRSINAERTPVPVSWRYNLEHILKIRCGEGNRLDEVGLGSAIPMILTSCEAEEERKKHLFYDDPNDEDESKERLTSGGIGGLFHAMICGKSLLGHWRSSNMEGMTTCEASWMLGRTTSEENSAKASFASLSLSGRLCSVCGSFTIPFF